jgi:ornithine cyclodeaminase/alanine dehydrogenase-like protein (mu-crystallin family)
MKICRFWRRQNRPAALLLLKYHISNFIRHHQANRSRPERSRRPSDVICCATRSTEEVFEADYVKPGTQIIGVGSYLPEMREIPLGAIEKATLIYADDYEGMKAEAGEFIDTVERGKWSFEELDGTLAELHLKSVERGVEDITIFKSVGAAHFDLAVAKGVFGKAEVLHEGEEIFL